MEYKKLNKNNKVGHTGICVDGKTLKRTGKEKYRAYITFQNKQYNLGIYNTLEKAIEKRKEAEEYIRQKLNKMLEEEE